MKEQITESTSDFFPDELVFKDGGMKSGSRLFIIKQSFRYVSGYGEIKVPALFVTDGASIPRMFWNIFPPTGSYFKAAIIHDYLYSSLNDKFSRSESDLIFKEAMFNLGIGWIKRETIYRAVQLFGWTAFKGLKE